MLTQAKIDALIGFAIKARRIALGETILIKAREGKCRLVLLANDASEGTQKKFLDKLGYYQCSTLTYGTKESLGNLPTKEAVSAVAILDNNIAKQIEKIAKVGD